MDATDPTSPDRELVGRLRAGDERAFEAVFREHYDGLCRFASAMVGSDAEAEELTQEMLLRIWQQRESLMIAGSLAAYLFASVRNAALNRLRRSRAEQRWREQVHRERDVSSHGSEPARADDDLRTTELSAAIERAVEELPPRRRQAYILRRQHHLSYAEIAAVMEIAPKTVEIQIGAALRTLREKLAEWF